jgi:hypothetical protein
MSGPDCIGYRPQYFPFYTSVIRLLFHCRSDDLIRGRLVIHSLDSIFRNNHVSTNVSIILMMMHPYTDIAAAASILQQYWLRRV